MCFDCNQIGHMKNLCPGTNQPRLSSKRPSSPSPSQTSATNKKHSAEVDSRRSSMSEGYTSSLVTQLPSIRYPEMEEQVVALFKHPDPPAPSTYKLLVHRDSSTVYISTKGSPIVVTPPERSTVPKKQQKTESKGCSNDNSRLIGMWESALISADDMARHFRVHHDNLISLDPS